MRGARALLEGCVLRGGRMRAAAVAAGALAGAAGALWWTEDRWSERFRAGRKPAYATGVDVMAGCMVSHDLGRHVAEPAIHAPPVPEGMDLVMAQVMHRHGDRSPVSMQALGPDGKPARDVVVWTPIVGKNLPTGPSWNQWSEVERSLATGGVTFHLVADLAHGQSVSAESARTLDRIENPARGQLTQRGLHQMHALGAALRRHYVAAGLLSPSWMSESSGRAVIHVSATNLRRTIQSASSLVAGLAGVGRPDAQKKTTAAAPKMSADFPVHVVADVGRETMFSYWPGCQQMDVLYRRVRHEGAMKDMEDSDRVRDLRSRLSERLGITGFLAAFEYLACYSSHDLAFPAGVSKNDFKELSSLVVRRFNLKTADRELLRLQVGRALYRAAVRFEAAMVGLPSPKLYLDSAHDTTLALLLRVLEGRLCSWPPYASFFQLELLHERSNSAPTTSHLHEQPATPGGPDGWYVRMLYNGRPVQMPGARPDGVISMREWRRFTDDFVVREHAEVECAIKSEAEEDDDQPEGS